jgi:hypothetical protein
MHRFIPRNASKVITNKLKVRFKIVAIAYGLAWGNNKRVRSFRCGDLISREILIR